MLKLLRYKNSQNQQKVFEAPKSGSQDKDNSIWNENRDSGWSASSSKDDRGSITASRQSKIATARGGASARVTASWNHRSCNPPPSKRASDEEEKGEFFEHNDVKFGMHNLSHYLLGDADEPENLTYVFQGLATCIVAFGELYNTPVLKWNSEVLDRILVQGRKLFNKSLRENGGSIWVKERVSKKFTLGNNMMEVFLSEPIVSGALHSPNPRVYNIDVGLGMVLQSYDYCLCKISDEYFLIWKHHGSYLIYDCYGRSSALDRDVTMGSAAVICVGAISTISSLFRLKSGMKACAVYSLYAVQMQVMRPCADRRKMKTAKTWDKSNYCSVGSDHAILEGKSGALAEYFKDTRCKHSLPIALVGILYSKINDPSSWDTSVVESIVKIGHNLYEKSVKYDPNNRLVLENIPQTIPIGRSLVEFELIPSTTKRIWSRAGVFEAHEGVERIKRILVENNSANLLIQVNQISYGLFVQDGHYYVLDPYPRQKVGNTVVHKFHTVESLCNALVQKIIRVPYSCTYLLHFVDVLKVNSPYEQNLLQLIKDTLADRPQRFQADDSPSKGKRNKARKQSRKRGQRPNVVAAKVAAARTARLNSRKSKTKQHADSDDTSKYQSAELTDLETAQSALEQLQRFSDTEKQYVTASSSDNDSTTSDVFTGDSREALQLSNDPKKSPKTISTRQNSSEDNYLKASQDGNFQFRFHASKKIVRMVARGEQNKKGVVWKRSCRYLTTSCSCEKIRSSTKLNRVAGSGRPLKQQAYIRAVCGRTTSLDRNRGKMCGTESKGIVERNCEGVCRDPSLDVEPNEDESLSSSLEKSCLSGDEVAGHATDSTINPDLSEAPVRSYNCELDKVGGDGLNNLHQRCVVDEGCESALPGIIKTSQRNSPKQADSISGRQHELVEAKKDLFMIDQSMAVVGSATGSYDSLQALMVAGFRVTDRILIMTPWGNYVVFKHGRNFFLHEGCTCHPERFRLLNLEMGTAGLLQFSTMHDLVLKILHGNLAGDSCCSRNGRMDYYSCRGACANSNFNNHILK